MAVKSFAMVQIRVKHKIIELIVMVLAKVNINLYSMPDSSGRGSRQYTVAIKGLIVSMICK